MPAKKTKSPDHNNLLDWLDAIPPSLLRYCAVKEGRLASIQELTSASGISRREIQRIITKKTWGGLRFDFVSQFWEACGYNPANSTSLENLMLVIEGGFKHLTENEHGKLKKMGWE